LKFLLLITLLCPATALADAPDGQQIALHGNDNGALPCAACHGAQGQGNASIGAPRLAGLPSAQIETVLKQFASGAGGKATMQNIAQALSPAETAAVAAYFAGLKAP
jgi:cytochrome c553